MEPLSAYSDRLAPSHSSKNIHPPAARSGQSTASTSPIDLRSTLRFPMPPDGRRSPASSPTPDGSINNAVSRSSARRRQFNDGPPTSGNSTPLREPIIESPTGDSFPDFNQTYLLPPPGLQPTPAGSLANLQLRRRAGTLPSRLPGGLTSKLSVPILRSSRPSVTPVQQESGHSSSYNFSSGSKLSQPPTSASSIPQPPPGLATPQPQQPLSSILTSWPARFRSDSLPANRLILSAFGNQPDRGSPLAHLVTSEDDNTPAGIALLANSKQALVDGGVRTLDYLGLMDPSLVMAASEQEFSPTAVRTADVSGPRPPPTTSIASRFRSYSVNASERYAEPIPAGFTPSLPPVGSGGMGDSSQMSIQEAINQHNRDVEAFLRIKSSLARPRSKTTAATFNPVPFPQMNTPGMTTESTNSADISGSGLSPDMPALGSLNLGGNSESSGDSPTRAIWLGNIPSSTTISSLNVIFARFGGIESSRVLTHKSCGFVNFDTVESAVLARAQLNGKEIFPGAGPTRIGFAKAPSRSNTPALRSTPPDSSDFDLPSLGFQQGGMDRPARDPEQQYSLLKVPTPSEINYDIMAIITELGATPEELATIAVCLKSALQDNTFCTDIPNVPEPRPDRVHDAPRLREVRKRIDNHSYTQTDIEEITMDMLPEIAELASDYLGNTVVQKLFEYCSDSIREAMLAEISVHLAAIGVHKNGTWAAQKIIDVSRSNALMGMVSEALRPYAVSLFLDQFGNYVIQGCLRYMAPLNNFIFEAMVNNLWDLSQGRFGARAMRACLESHYATKSQQMMVAAAVAIHSVRLATNANGALLLTWFLDTCTLSNRRAVLAPRLIPYLVELCTHKVAYLTVLKLINQRTEPEARSSILQALFFSPNLSILEGILSDFNCGPTFIFKVLTSPFLEDEMRPEVMQNVRNVLQRIKAQPNQGYKRLMDEVGLSTRHASNQNSTREPKPSHIIDSDKSEDPASSHRSHPGRPSTSHMQQPGLGNYMGESSVNMPSSEMPIQSAFPSFPPGIDPNMYAAMASGVPMPYQQPLQQSTQRPGYYPPIGMARYNAPMGMMDSQRTNSAGMSHPMGPAPITHSGYTNYPPNAHPAFPYAISYGAQSQQSDPARRGMGYQ